MRVHVLMTDAAGPVASVHIQEARATPTRRLTCMGEGLRVGHYHDQNLFEEWHGMVWVAWVSTCILQCP